MGGIKWNSMHLCASCVHHCICTYIACDECVCACVCVRACVCTVISSANEVYCTLIKPNMTSDSDCGSEYPEEHSRSVGLTVACLIDDEELPTLTCLTKGIVYELSLLRKAYNISWSQFYDWAKALSGGSFATFASFKVTVGRIEKKRAELSLNKKHDELERLTSAI